MSPFPSPIYRVCVSTLTTPVENIPVLIVTDSIDKCRDSMLMSRGSGESTGSEDEVETIPMSITNCVSSPSKHRYYGQEVLNEGESSANAREKNRPVLALDTTGGYGDEAIAGKPRNWRRPSVSISLSPMHSSNTGMDEFLLISPTTPEPLSRSRSVRRVLGTHSPRPSMSSGVPLSPDAPPPSSSLPPSHAMSMSIPTDPHRSPGLVTTERDADVRIFMPAVDFGEPVPMTFKAFPFLRDTSLVQSTHVSVVGFVLSTVLVLIAIVYGIVSST